MVAVDRPSLTSKLVSIEAGGEIIDARFVRESAAFATGAGEILISAATAGDFVQITVADTGPGLAPNVVNQLFQAFVSTKRDGMGLGLSICRTIIEGHGGRIWAEARPSGGTLFHFTVPLAVTENIDG